MLRRLALIFTIISLVFLPLFFAPNVSAWKLGDMITNKADFEAALNTGSEKNLQDFCAKRQGNQMNLETWYSGKCPDDKSTFDAMSGEGVGFSDIVLLDLMERLDSEKDPNKSFFDILKDIYEKFEEKQELEVFLTPQEQQLALESAREKLFASSNSGILGQSGKMIGMLFQNQPASTTSYLAYVSQNLQKNKIIPPVLAANGVGFETFSPFLTIWIAFRNLAYLGLVVFFIVYGFMMMFRVNLGQKTVISVQLAIPKLIVTLLVITFSFAIVGLIYDLMWVLIAFIFAYFKSQGIIVSTFFPHIAGGNTFVGLPGSMVLNMIIAGPSATFGALNLIFGGIGASVLMVVGSITKINLLINIIVAIAVIISYAKLFFKLISAFISITISLVTSPIVLLGNAFPGSQAIGTWLRGIVANLSVFPVTMLLLFFSYLLMIQPVVGICSDMGGAIIDISGPCEWVFGVKSLVTGTTGLYGVPLMSPWGFSSRGLLALLGVGLLLMASKYVDIVRDALKVPPFKYGSDIADALKSGYKGASNWAKNDYKGMPRSIADKMSSQWGPNAKGEMEAHLGGRTFNTDKIANGK